MSTILQIQVSEVSSAQEKDIAFERMRSSPGVYTAEDKPGYIVSNHAKEVFHFNNGTLIYIHGGPWLDARYTLLQAELHIRFVNKY